VAGPGSKIESKSEQDQKTLSEKSDDLPDRDRAQSERLVRPLCLRAKLAKLSKQYSRILDGISVAVVVKIRPDPNRAASGNPRSPGLQFCRRIIMLIPPLKPMKTDIDFVRRFY
jgi:hypothetical protein